MYGTESNSATYLGILGKSQRAFIFCKLKFVDAKAPIPHICVISTTVMDFQCIYATIALQFNEEGRVTWLPPPPPPPLPLSLTTAD